MEVAFKETHPRLSRLLERLASALKMPAKKRQLGSAKGEFTVPDDFNDPLPKEIEDLFWESKLGH